MLEEFPGFLRQPLNLDGDWEEKVEMLYHKIFLLDFDEVGCFLEGKQIFYHRAKQSDGKADLFWHLITRTNNGASGERIPDFARAKRLHWIRPIIENSLHPEVLMWDYLEANGRVHRYLWLHRYDYVVILGYGRNKDCFFLVTAFYVEKYKKRDLEKRFKKRIDE